MFQGLPAAVIHRHIAWSERLICGPPLAKKTYPGVFGLFDEYPYRTSTISECKGRKKTIVVQEMPQKKQNLLTDIHFIPLIVCQFIFL